MKYAAFLRGINVGGRVIKMADLKACFEMLGFQDVVTILQTGNVVFTSNKNPTTLKATIETGLTKSFDYPAIVQVLSMDSLQAIIDAYPFHDHDDAHHDYIVFVEKGLEKQLIDEVQFDKTTEQIARGGGVIYWRVPKGSTLKSSFAQYLTKTRFKAFHTNRNLRTLKKIVAG